MWGNLLERIKSITKTLNDCNGTQTHDDLV